ncbi:hypothetical protein DK419_10840 [Methylobacterium terrae]|uniref:Uncharacterized protein n=1 Tax=Methylobacterium terrae TaxID=2202827 RepID=A0A2U8WKS4_9HYPH|nr:hypothetical protein [Methylobacterium terrae]AWN46747.1 hypothetical protein DK419_10840 [Methylobacterium terrae]
MLATAQGHVDAERLRRMGEGLTAQVRQARLGLEEAVADARRLLAEARRLAARRPPDGRT